MPLPLIFHCNNSSLLDNSLDAEQGTHRAITGKEQVWIRAQTPNSRAAGSKFAHLARFTPIVWDASAVKWDSNTPKWDENPDKWDDGGD